MRMDLRDDRGAFTHERAKQQTLEDKTRADNLVLAARKMKLKSGYAPWKWLRQTLAEHFARVRLEALREAASFQCQDCRECIPLEKSGSGLYAERVVWVHAHHGVRPGWINRRLVVCRANQLRNSTSLGGFVR